MSEYRVTFTEVPNLRSDNETHVGVFLHIQPPVQLNPDAVERYITFGDFEPIDRSGNWEKLDIKDVAVLGSTAEQTTIYASIANSYEDGELAEQVANKTVKLLRFMGVQAIVDNPPTPEA